MKKLSCIFFVLITFYIAGCNIPWDKFDPKGFIDQLDIKGGIERIKNISPGGKNSADYCPLLLDNIQQQQIYFKDLLSYHQSKDVYKISHVKEGLERLVEEMLEVMNRVLNNAQQGNIFCMRNEEKHSFSLSEARRMLSLLKTENELRDKVLSYGVTMDDYDKANKVIDIITTSNDEEARDIIAKVAHLVYVKPDHDIFFVADFTNYLASMYDKLDKDYCIADFINAMKRQKTQVLKSADYGSLHNFRAVFNALPQREGPHECNFYAPRE